MSDATAGHGDITLEEALNEIESLRAQLSGSDLKVFAQNRDLRQENQKLKLEIQRLAEECVTQTFAIKDLEKTNEQLQDTVSELEGEIGVHKSQELHLSQELQRTVTTNEEAVQRLRAEHTREVAQTKEQLEQAKADLESELREHIQAKEAEIAELQDRVEQFKEEFLSQEFDVPTLLDSGLGGEASPLAMLTEKMEGLLGFPGRALVEQVFKLCGAEPNCSDPGKLEETFEALQDTAGKFVQTPEQERELALLLENAWRDLGLGQSLSAVHSSAPTASSGEDRAAPVEPTETAIEEPSRKPSDEPQSAESMEPPVADPVAVEAPPSDLEVPLAEDSEGSLLASDSSEATFEEAVEESGEPSFEQAGGDITQARSELGAEEVTSVELSPVAEDAGSTELSEPTTEEQTTDAGSPPPMTSLEGEPAELFDEIPAALEQSDERQVSFEAEATSSGEEEPQPEDDSDALLDLIVEEPPASSPVERREPLVEESAEELAAPRVEANEPPVASLHPGEVEGSVEGSVPLQTLAPPAEEAAAQIEVAEVSEEASPYEVAAALLENERYAEALPLLEQLSTESPDHPVYLVSQLDCLVGLERFRDAYRLGRGVDPDSLGEHSSAFRQGFEAALNGQVRTTESEVLKKMTLIELAELAEDDGARQSYLEAAEGIPFRTPEDGRLNLYLARYRVGEEDVTDYLIEALHSCGGNHEIFELLQLNLENYPDLEPLSNFLQTLMTAPRDESLDAEDRIREFLPLEESISELILKPDPTEEELVPVFLDHLIPRLGVSLDIPSEDFEELLQDSETAAFLGSLRQALRSINFTEFFDELEVLGYDGDEHFILRSSPEPKPTLLFGADIDDVPPEELRFLALRELYALFRKHGHLSHLAAELDDSVRLMLVEACVKLHREANIEFPEELVDRLDSLQGAAIAGGQDPGVRRELLKLVCELYGATASESFLDLADFLYDNQLVRKQFDHVADSFAARQTGMVVASYAIARDYLDPDDFETLEENGFGWLYSEENEDRYTDLRLRLQRLWTLPFRLTGNELDD